MTNKFPCRLEGVIKSLWVSMWVTPQSGTEFPEERKTAGSGHARQHCQRYDRPPFSVWVADSVLPLPALWSADLPPASSSSLLFEFYETSSCFRSRVTGRSILLFHGPMFGKIREIKRDVNRTSKFTYIQSIIRRPFPHLYTVPYPDFFYPFSSSRRPVMLVGFPVG